MKKRFAIGFGIGLFVFINLLAAPMTLSALAGRCSFMKRAGLLIDLFSTSAN